MTDFERLIRALAESGAQVTLIGGNAMRLHGSAYLTEDVDFAFARTRENARRIVRALRPYHPRPREFPPDVPFVFDAQAVLSSTIVALHTDLGDVDLLGEVAGVGSYAQIERESELFDVNGLAVRVLTLDALIRSKIAIGRQKDRAAVVELEAIREAREGTLRND